MRDPAHITHVEYLWSPYYKSTQIPPIQISSLGYQLGKCFKILTYRKITEHMIMVQVECL